MTIRSSDGMKPERMLGRVVLPDEVPPETRMLSRLRTAARRNCIISGLALPIARRSAGRSLSRENLRMVMHGPSIASGGSTTFTRDPSRSLASHIGELSSTRLPTVLTMRSITCRSWAALSKTTGLRLTRPLRST